MTKHLKGNIIVANRRRQSRLHGGAPVRRFSATLCRRPLAPLAATRLQSGSYLTRSRNVTKQVWRGWGGGVGTTVHVFSPSRSMKNKQAADWRHLLHRRGFLKKVWPLLPGRPCQTRSFEKPFWFSLTWSQFNRTDRWEMKVAKSRVLSPFFLYWSNGVI